jgi:hypothetical protein
VEVYNEQKIKNKYKLFLFLFENNPTKQKQKTVNKYKNFMKKNFKFLLLKNECLFGFRFIISF